MLIKELLENDHPLFVRNIAELERATGNAGVDTRLVADIMHKAHEVMRALGLNVADTTSAELYNALKGSVKDGRAEMLLRDTSYVLMSFGEGSISFNLRDVIENAHHELSYENRHSEHGKRHLRLEIIKRYAEHDRTYDQIVHELASEIGLKLSDDEGYPTAALSTEYQPSLLAVGDIFTDAFIKLREDQARIDTDSDGSKRLSMPFGSKPPYERVDIVQAVGPSPNAAVSCARLGLDVSLMAWLGDDKPGEDSLGYLRSQGVSTSLVTRQENTKSNYYYVLRYGADRTILVKNEDYAYQWLSPEREVDWIYLSLISEASWGLHEDMLLYLDAHPKTKLAFQPGTFHFQWGAEKLAKIYARAHIIILNREEAAQVTGLSAESIKDLSTALRSMGPNIVIITDGPAGAYASYDDRCIKMPNYPDPAPPFERTGAGDAFASTIVAALALGQPIETALRWAPINSMSVVQKMGAQAGLLSKNRIEEYLSKAPTDYKPEEI